MTNDMKEIPNLAEKNNSFNKKSLIFISILIICGIVTGIILSGLFMIEANENIGKWKEDRWFPQDNEIEPLIFSDIIIPSIGVVIVCISTYLLIGLIIVYIKIFLKTSSQYIVGLLFFLIPLFIQSIFSLNTLRSLFVSSAIPIRPIKESIGFGIGGFGGILVILSIFEIIGLAILLYLSSE